MGTVYNTNVVTDGLVACWDAANRRSYPATGALWTDIAGNNIGTLSSGPTFSSDNMGTISFDGSDDYVEIPDSDVFDFGTGSFSISMWFKCFTDVTPGYQCLFYHHYSPGTLINILSATGEDRELQWYLGGVAKEGTSNLWDDGEWRNAVVTREDGGAYAIYIDTVLENSGTGLTGNASSTDVMGFGRYVGTSGTSYPFYGLMSNIFLYSKALTAAEVLQNYNATKRRYIGTESDSLVLDMDAGDKRSYPGAGTVWTDLAQGNVGTLTSGPTFSTDDGGSIEFDGTDDYVLTQGITLGSSFSISCWIKYAASPEYRTIMTSRNYYAVGYDGNFGIRAESATKVAFFSGDERGTQEVWPTTFTVPTIDTSTWYNLTVSCDGVNVSVYWQGSLIGSAAHTNALVDASNGIVIGGDISWSNAEWDGNIAIVEIYNRALTTAEILDRYNKTKGRFA